VKFAVKSDGDVGGEEVQELTVLGLHVRMCVRACTCVSVCAYAPRTRMCVSITELHASVS
jgi:hypothetical protein